MNGQLTDDQHAEFIRASLLAESSGRKWLAGDKPGAVIDLVRAVEAQPTPGGRLALIDRAIEVLCELKFEAQQQVH